MWSIKTENYTIIPTSKQDPEQYNKLSTDVNSKNKLVISLRNKIERKKFSMPDEDMLILVNQYNSTVNEYNIALNKLKHFSTIVFNKN